MHELSGEIVHIQIIITEDFKVSQERQAQKNTGMHLWLNCVFFNFAFKLRLEKIISKAQVLKNKNGV